MIKDFLIDTFICSKRIRIFAGLRHCNFFSNRNHFLAFWVLLIWWGVFRHPKKLSVQFISLTSYLSNSFSMEMSWSSRPGLENNVSQRMVCVYLNHSCYVQFVVLLWSVPGTAQKMKFSIKDFLSKGDHIRSLLRIWSHSLKKSFMENLIFCAVWMYFIFIVKDDRLIKASQDIWLVYLASKLSHVRIECGNTWPLALIFWHFVETQYDYIDHAFLAFSQNVPCVFIRVILIIAVILFTEFKAWAQYLVFIKTAGLVLFSLLITSVIANHKRGLLQRITNWFKIWQ